MARVVFDLDGTLIDSAPDIRGVANRLLSDEGLAPVTLAQTKTFIGDGAAMFVTRMRAARGVAQREQARLLAGFVAAYDEAVGLTHPYPGVIAALGALRGAGHRLGVCTNKPIAPCRSVLAHLDMAHMFDAVLGGDSLAVRKPDPAPLHATFKAIGDSGAMLYVGDSDVDAETARRAGVPFLLFTEGYRKAPVAALPHLAAFSDFDALPGLVDTALAAKSA